MNLSAALLIIGQTISGGSGQPPISSQFDASAPVVASEEHGSSSSVAPLSLSDGSDAAPAVGSAPLDLGARPPAALDSPPPRPMSRAAVAAPAAPPVRTSFQDQGVAPAAAAGAALPANAEPTTRGAAAPSPELQAAAERLRAILAVDDQAAQQVRRVRLVDALARAGDPGTQKAAIDAYWNLVQAIARARFAADKVQSLLAVPEPAQSADQGLLEAALTRAEADQEAAEDQVTAAQFRLTGAGLLAWDGLLPWPADLPLVSAYRTNFEMYYAQRPASLEVRHIHHSLPQKLVVIERRVRAAAAAEAAQDAMLESYRGGRLPLALLLQAIEGTETARREFITAVIDYNGRIADYSLATVGLTLAPETLVSTLIRTNSPTTSLVTVPNEVRPAVSATSILPPDGTIYRR